MATPIAYLDLNVISHLKNKDYNFSKIGNVQWVYSYVHLEEIYRSQCPQGLLSSLEELSASLLTIPAPYARKKLYVSLNDIPPSEAFEDYRKNKNPYSKVFDHPLQQIAWWAGANGSKNNNVEEIRRLHNFNINEASNISGDNILKQIWEKAKNSPIGEQCGDIDSFFGFSARYYEEKKEIPLREGIIKCYCILELLGFHPDKKFRNPSKIKNSFSDAQHIAMAAGCAVLVTHDKKLAKKAHAIYEYKKINTLVHLLKAPNS